MRFLIGTLLLVSCLAGAHGAAERAAVTPAGPALSQPLSQAKIDLLRKALDVIEMDAALVTAAAAALPRQGSQAHIDLMEEALALAEEVPLCQARIDLVGKAMVLAEVLLDRMEKADAPLEQFEQMAKQVNRLNDMVNRIAEATKVQSHR